MDELLQVNGIGSIFDSRRGVEYQCDTFCTGKRLLQVFEQTEVTEL